MDEPSQGSAKGPVDHTWNRAFCYRVEVLYKLFRLLFKCYFFYACVYILFCYHCASGTDFQENVL
jgi:hypothetical protein